MDSCNITRNTFDRKIVVSDPIASDVISSSTENNITLLKEIKELMGSTPYNEYVSVGENILAAIENKTFPTKEEVVENLDSFSKLLVDKKLPSALEILNPAESTIKLSQQIKKGWRWVTAAGLENLVANAKVMPTLIKDDWVLLDGKTMRLIRQNSKGNPTGLLQYLETYRPSESHPSERINFSRYSYSRVAGAYIRHAERLEQLGLVFWEFFDVKEVPKTIFVNLKDCEAKRYDKYKIVTLKEERLSNNGKLKLLCQALGIAIEINDKSTIANTIPFKKVLEILTCFNPIYYADCPWLVCLNIFGGERGFLLSRGQSSPSTLDNTKYQLLVSMLSNTAYKEETGQEFPRYIGNRYSHWMDNGELDAKMLLKALDDPISSSTTHEPYWEKIIEFLVCTHVAESHCDPKHRDKSRTPGAGKLTRAILRDHIRSGALLSPSSFPMAGNGGTERMREIVEELCFRITPYDDISDDSEREEISELQNVSGEGEEHQNVQVGQVKRKGYQKIETNLMTFNDISKTANERADAAYKIALQFLMEVGVSLNEDLAEFFLEQASKLNHKVAADILRERKRPILF